MKTVTVSVFVVVASVVAAMVTASPSPAVAEDPAPVPAPAKANVPVEFPSGWAGTYRGPLEIQNAAGKRQTIQMQFTVAPTRDPRRVKWIIAYEGQPKRNYELVTVDAKRRLYKIDEKNSIEISASLLGGELVSIFSVAGNQLLAKYRLEGERLIYEVATWREVPTALTGGRNGIPVVQTFQPMNVQKAVLERVKPAQK